MLEGRFKGSDTKVSVEFAASASIVLQAFDDLVRKAPSHSDPALFILSRSD